MMQSICTVRVLQGLDYHLTHDVPRQQNPHWPRSFASTPDLLSQAEDGCIGMQVRSPLASLVPSKATNFDLALTPVMARTQ
jgi:hypothetical protein